ncbi:MAG: hypothetical protein JOZ69_22005 [Myxococcales bacterium]|nr:hypothetical protein [Myxococcales bacterium]
MRFEWLGVVLALAACGGRVESTDGSTPGNPTEGDRQGQVDGDDAGPGDHPDAAGNATHTRDRGPDQPVVIGICPASPPAAGMACATPGQGCIYDQGLSTCQALLCLSRGHWASVPPACR